MTHSIDRPANSFILNASGRTLKHCQLMSWQIYLNVFLLTPEYEDTFRYDGTCFAATTCLPHEKNVMLHFSRRARPGDKTTVF